jgi:hypothetical protein
MPPATSDVLSPEERHQVYNMLGLTIEVSPDGSLDIRVVLKDSFVSGNRDERLCFKVQNTMTSEVLFRAKLSEYGVEQLELARA